LTREGAESGHLVYSSNHVLLKMVLELAQLRHSLVFQTGQDVMTNNSVVLFGMRPGNPYFKSRVIEDYVKYLGRQNRRIIVVVPQQPAEHTYRALGSKDAVKRAKRNSSKLKSLCKIAIEKVTNAVK
jgi:tRNA-dependent cyclodipeptide synthase